MRYLTVRDLHTLPSGTQVATLRTTGTSYRGPVLLHDIEVGAILGHGRLVSVVQEGPLHRWTVDHVESLLPIPCRLLPGLHVVPEATRALLNARLADHEPTVSVTTSGSVMVLCSCGWSRKRTSREVGRREFLQHRSHALRDPRRDSPRRKEAPGPVPPQLSMAATKPLAARRLVDPADGLRVMASERKAKVRVWCDGLVIDLPGHERVEYEQAPSDLTRGKVGCTACQFVLRRRRAADRKAAQLGMPEPMPPPPPAPVVAWSPA